MLMVGKDAPRGRDAAASADADGGFTLLEVIVSMVVFSVVVTGALAVLLKTTQVAGSNTRRVVAANLATKQIEAARSQTALQIPDGLVSRTEVVGKTTYTVNQTSNYLPSDSATSVCSGSGNNLAYKLVSVDVTWPNMGAVKPVHSDTLRALGLGADGLDPSQGAVAVLVQGANGPVSGMQVTLTPGGQTRTTGADGCAVFVGLTDGQNYTATVNTAGYVSNTNLQYMQNANLGVRKSEVTRGTILYDQAGSFNLSWDVPAGYDVPDGLPVMMRNSFLSDRSYPTCVSLGSTVAGCVDGVPGTAKNLFPAVYDVWAGTCSDSRTPASVTLAPGGAEDVAIPLAPVTFHFVNKQGQPIGAHQVQATHAPEAAPPTATTFCGSGESWSWSGSGGKRSVDAALPTGTWTFTSPGSQPVTVEMTTGSNPDITFVVGS
jgi:prepilin-type N-terminal cleavage/methylation domain-containing protein